MWLCFPQGSFSLAIRLGGRVFFEQETLVGQHFSHPVSELETACLRVHMASESHEVCQLVHQTKLILHPRSTPTAAHCRPINLPLGCVSLGSKAARLSREPRRVRSSPPIPLPGRKEVSANQPTDRSPDGAEFRL